VKYSDSIEARLTGRHKRCIKISGSLSGKSLLNVGCYNGWYEKFAVSRGSRIIGIDVDGRMLKLATKEVKESDFIQASALFLPFPPHIFDQVTMFDVIEHLPENTEGSALTEIRRVIRNKGNMMLSTPSKYFLSRMIDPAWVLRKHRHYSLAEIRAFLERSGFSITMVGYGGQMAEQISMILLYIFKKFKREIFFKRYFDVLRDREYLDDEGFVTMFLKAEAG
jgi:ubiquinone/menaquinone biosynthesis C-methylase UbiE